MSGTGLILAGHGSHISPETAGLVWRRVDALRAMGVADEVTAAFWKEAPSFHTVMNSLTALDITVVPLFTAQGYFTQTVIPTEMGLDSALTVRDGRTIRYTRTLNEHHYLSEIVRRRVEDTIGQFQLSGDRTAVAIIGHSTRRNPESRKATEAQAEKIRSLRVVSQVEAVFLDDSPEILEIYRMTDAPTLIAVPYFLALGSHTTLDVPHELGLEPGQSTGRIHGRAVYYTEPVGIEDNLDAVILELAHDAGALLRTSRSGSEWDCFPMAGRDDLIEAVKASGVMQFGQLRLTPDEVRVMGNDYAAERLDTPSALRTRVRDNPFRSLVTSADLPSGWHMAISEPKMLHAVVETTYPGAAADWAASRRGTFGVNTLAATIGRQTGNYRRLAALDLAATVDIVAASCGSCVRHPTWHQGQSDRDMIPCPEPCNHWLSRALETME
jgi:sirohydrochlorin cobaltochelatase